MDVPDPDQTVKKQGVIYQSVSQDQAPPFAPAKCGIRSDDTGGWAAFQAWYLFFIHLIASILVTVGIVEIDGLKFQIGTGPSIFSLDGTLHQAQVTGLLTLALVIIRLIAGACSALLVWRIIFILLEKRGISLAEITRLTNWRVPILPGLRSRTSVVWSLWAALTIFLLWPQGFAAPLASSALSWIPGRRLLSDYRTTSVASVGTNPDWTALVYDQLRAPIIVGAATNTAKDPYYAFNSTQLPLRRYFTSSRPLPDGSLIDLTVPYFAVDLHWINSTSNNSTANAGQSEYTDINNWFSIRINGTTAIVNDEQWNPVTAIQDAATGATVFKGKKLVSIKITTLSANDTLSDGTKVTDKTKCPTVSDQLGKLPKVQQQQYTMVNSGTEEFLANDCYLFAEATIVAGQYLARGCNVTAPSATSEYYATCSMERDDSIAKKDWFTELSLDFLSEILKYSVMLNYTQPWINDNLEEYTTGMLTLGYHAAWSGLMGRVGNGTETVKFRPTEEIVSASIDRNKVYIWLAMNLTLLIAAVLTYIAQSLSTTKTIRDTTVAAMTVDLTDIAHSGRANGLCSAVDLSRNDERLPRLKWDGAMTRNKSQEEGVVGQSCTRRVVFVDEQT